MEQIAVRIDDAARMVGLGRTKLYFLIGEGRIETVKIGRRTLVKVESLKRLIDEAA